MEGSWGLAGGPGGFKFGLSRSQVGCRRVLMLGDSRR